MVELTKPSSTSWTAIFYAVRARHVWRLLPQEWPPWKTVYDYYRR
jgi:transposase